MPYDSYRLYQAERAKNSAEIRRADEQLGRLAAAASRLFRGIMRPARAVRMRYPAAAPSGACHREEPAGRRGRIVETMEGS